MKKIVIVGGGASGMMAAIAAAKENPAAQIRILERKDLPGKKILSTGNGRCNFTNQVMNANCFFSDTPNGKCCSNSEQLKHWMYSLILVFFPRTETAITIRVLIRRHQS